MESLNGVGEMVHFAVQMLLLFSKERLHVADEECFSLNFTFGQVLRDVVWLQALYS